MLRSRPLSLKAPPHSGSILRSRPLSLKAPPHSEPRGERSVVSPAAGRVLSTRRRGLGKRVAPAERG